MGAAARGPDSKPVAVPGGGGEMRLTDAGLRATGTNSAATRSSAARRRPSPPALRSAAPASSARCSAPRGTEVAQTPTLRASYPRSSDDLIDNQEALETSLAEFSSQEKRPGRRSMTSTCRRASPPSAGIKLEWPTYKVGVERSLLPPRPAQAGAGAALPTIWRARSSRRRSLLHPDHQRRRRDRRTAGAMRQGSPPIDEG